jgi:hypothetical protein
MCQEGQDVTGISDVSINPDDCDVLIDTSGEDVLRNGTGTREGDPITGDVEEQVTGLKFDILQSIGLLVRNEC